MKKSKIMHCLHSPLSRSSEGTFPVSQLAQPFHELHSALQELLEVLDLQQQLVSSVHDLYKLSDLGSRGWPYIK